MAISKFSRTYTVERQFVGYDARNFQEIYDFFYKEHGVVLQPVDEVPSVHRYVPMVKFQSESGSTSHYVRDGEVIVIDEKGEVRAAIDEDGSPYA